ncbi:MAG: cytochrome c biogenesis protein CcdA [Firmicutes bacterium]|nr:cytochrome c biogenesis protein CcdA [Bacillota bacterium]
MPSVSVLAAFLAGLVSFISPCVLPLVPTYITYLGGGSAEIVATEGTASARKTLYLNSVLFIVGFSVIFILLGLAASGVGQLLRTYHGVLVRVAGILIIGFGVLQLASLRYAFLNREFRLQVREQSVSWVTSLLIGMAFAIGWTPCIGPILGSIWLLASTQETLWQGAGLLTIYSAGLALPFLAVTVLLGRFMGWFRRFSRYLPWITVASGILMIVLGIMVLSGTFARLASLVPGL